MPKISDLIIFHVSCLTFCGAWQDPSTNWKQRLRNFTKIFVFCVLSGISIFSAIWKLENPSEFIIACSFAVSAFSVWLKMQNVCRKTPKIEQILNDLNEIQLSNMGNDCNYYTVTAKKVTQLPKILGGVFAFVGISTIVEPIVRQEKTLPLPTQYPFDWQSSTALWLLLYFYETLVAGYYIIFVAASDTLSSCILLIIDGQLDTLGYRLENLPKKHPTDWKKRFGECADDYNKIFKVCRDYEKLFSSVISFQTIISCIMLCTNAYAVRSAATGSSFINFLSFLGSMIYQIIVPCYTGQEILSKSEALLFKMYSSDWPDESREYRKMILIFSERLKRPITIRFFHIYILRLKTFTTIVKHAYSLYALLHKLT